MGSSDERLTTQTELVGLDAPPLEEVLAAHLFHSETSGDFGLEFEEDGAAQHAPDAVRAENPEEKPQARSATEMITDAPSQSGAAPELSADELAWALGWPTPTTPWTEPIPAVRHNRRVM